MTANKDIIYVLFATKVWEQGRHTVILFAVFIPFHTHKQHPALCSPLLLLREDVGWILTFRCTPLPHKHSLMHQYACAALSFGARGLGAGFSPDSMPPTWKSTCAPAVPVWGILSLSRGRFLCQQEEGTSNRYHVIQRSFVFVFSKTAALHANLLVVRLPVKLFFFSLCNHSNQGTFCINC